MSKLNLPKDWIVVNSSSHPDRVYYFNVKTKKSLWTLPSSNDVKETSPNPESAKKRKKVVENEGSNAHRPSTPENDSLEDNTIQRKKLVAKRFLPSPLKATKNETPQMIALREKMAKKKEQQVLAKGNKAVSNKAPKTPSPRPIATSQKLNAASPSRRSATRSSRLLKTSEKESPKKKEENLTPQMIVLREKMQQRALKEKPSTSTREVRSSTTTSANKKIIEADVEKPKTDVIPRSPRISRRRTTIRKATNTNVNIELEEHLASPDKSVSEADSGGEKPDSASSYDESTDSVRSRRSIGKKNLGKERMDKLRRSLKLERHKLLQIANANARRSLPTMSTKANDISDDTLPDIYKNVSARLAKLNEKLGLRNEILLHKKLIESQPGEAEECSNQSKSVRTVQDLIKQSVQACTYEEMDWEPMEDEKITVEVQAVRNQLYTSAYAGTKTNIPDNYLGQPITPNHQEKKQLYIVVDTNVLLSNIPAVNLARDTKFITYSHPIIVIPWTVIRELDYIKDNKGHTRSRALVNKARKAVEYLNKLFSSKQHIIGQTPEDVKKNKERFAVDCPDDEILQTCLQIRDLNKSVVLLSYDKNLCNKAMIYDITTLGRNDPLEKIDFLNAADSPSSKIQNLDCQGHYLTHMDRAITANGNVIDEVFEDLKTVVKDFLTDIVIKEMQQLYGDFWKNYVIIRPPWTTLCVLKCAIKHWIAATSESFSRRAEEILKELLRTFSSFPSDGRKLKDVVYTLERCRDLAQMVNTDKHANLMLQTLEKIDDLTEKISEYEMQQNRSKINDVIGVEDTIPKQQRRAEKAFRFFEAAYDHSRDICGLAAEIAGMPFTIPYERPKQIPPLDYVKQVQPEYAANVNKLLLILSAAIEEAESSKPDHRTLLNLHQALVTFLPEKLAPADDLTPLDVWCCIKQKLEMLKAGLRQLQELSTQFCRLASLKHT